MIEAYKVVSETEKDCMEMNCSRSVGVAAWNWPWLCNSC